jgi:hypothetical protein
MGKHYVIVIHFVRLIKKEWVINMHLSIYNFPNIILSLILENFWLSL